MFFPKNASPISKLYRGKLQDFITAPPVADAAEVFGYPAANLLSCYISDGRLCFDDDNNKDTANSFFIYLKAQHLNFSETNDGVAYKLITNNELFCTLELKNKERINIAKPDQEFRADGTFFISGKILCYSRDRTFHGLLEIDRNIVLSTQTGVIQ